MLPDNPASHHREGLMQLEGIHHITAIPGDAPRNVDFYSRVLGLRLVKKTVNQDNPTIYHLFYADEKGSAGSDLTFFEYPGARPGRAGAGMVHRIVWRVASPEALDFWAKRLEAENTETHREGDSLRFADPEGLDHELRITAVDDEPLIADHPEIRAEIAPLGPGFTADEPLEHLGESLSLPPAYEHLRDELSRTLTPLPDPHAWRESATKRA